MSAAARRPVFLPSDLSPADPLRDWRRSVVVKAAAALRGRTINEAAEGLYGPKLGASIVKAVVAPADTATPAWAGALVGTIIVPFLRSLRTKSAAAQLIEAGTLFDLRRGTISLPKLSTEFPNAAWIAEGAPAPVFQGSLTSTSLTPKKLMALSALTNELAERSAEDAERIIADLLEESAGRALDLKMFSADAATATAPAGLLNGIGATAGAAGGGQTAMATDLRVLAGAVATAGGGGNLVIVAAPGQAMALQVLAGAGLDAKVIIAPHLAAGAVIVLDAGAFVSGFSADPQIDIADNAVVHLEDTTPLAISTAGAPNTVAAPVRSAFQADLKVLRCILRVGYAMRSNAISWTSTATW